MIMVRATLSKLININCWTCFRPRHVNYSQTALGNKLWYNSTQLCAHTINASAHAVMMRARIKVHFLIWKCGGGVYAI